MQFSGLPSSEEHSFRSFGLLPSIETSQEKRTICWKEHKKTMAYRQLQTLLWVFVSLSLLCQSAEALAPTRMGKTASDPLGAERNYYNVPNQQSQSKDSENLHSESLSRRNVFRQAGIASATLFLSSIGFSNPLPARAADTTLDSYLVSEFFKFLNFVS